MKKTSLILTFFVVLFSMTTTQAQIQPNPNAQKAAEEKRIAALKKAADDKKAAAERAQQKALNDAKMAEAKKAAEEQRTIDDKKTASTPQAELGRVKRVQLDQIKTLNEINNCLIQKKNFFDKEPNVALESINAEFKKIPCDEKLNSYFNANSDSKPLYINLTIPNANTTKELANTANQILKIKSELKAEFEKNQRRNDKQTSEEYRKANFDFYSKYELKLADLERRISNPNMFPLN